MFDLVRKIGCGVDSTIYLVKEHNTGRQMVLKVLKNETRALEEARLHKSLEHPYIVQMADTFRRNGEVSMLIEYAPGGSLFGLIEKKGRIDEDDMRRYTFQTGVALRYLHSKGIIHLDIKPDNILIGDGGQVKLADFGISIQKERSVNVCGSAPYLPPEMVNEREYDRSADIWSFGATIYECVFGCPPFGNGEANGIFRRIAAMDFSIPKTSSPELADLLSRMLVEDPKKRLDIHGVLEHRWITGNRN